MALEEDPEKRVISITCKIKSEKSMNPFESVIQTAYDIVKANGAEIVVETIQGAGSEFII